MELCEDAYTQVLKSSYIKYKMVTVGCVKLCLYVHEIVVGQLINQFRAWQIVILWSSYHVKSYQNISYTYTEG